MSKKPLPSLKAMAEEKIEGIQKATIFKVDPDVVEFEEGFNLREEGPALDAHLEAMYQAMKAGAFVPPIDVIVVDGRVVARDGHCRTRTARRLKAEGIPYQLEARQFRGNEVESVFHMLGSAQGKAFTPIEQGRGFLRLMRYGLTVVQIAERMGLHRATIDFGLTLAEAPVEIQMLINGGAVSSVVAVDAIRKHGSKAAAHLQALIAKANGAGIQKVTKKHISGPRVPPKVVQSFVSATASLNNYFAEAPKEKRALDEGRTVMVPGALLKELLDAHAQIKTKETEL